MKLLEGKLIYNVHHISIFTTFYFLPVQYNDFLFVAVFCNHPALTIVECGDSKNFF